MKLLGQRDFSTFFESKIGTWCTFSGSASLAWWPSRRRMEHCICMSMSWAGFVAKLHNVKQVALEESNFGLAPRNSCVMAVSGFWKIASVMRVWNVNLPPSWLLLDVQLTDGCIFFQASQSNTPFIFPNTDETFFKVKEGLLKKTHRKLLW